MSTLKLQADVEAAARAILPLVDNGSRSCPSLTPETKKLLLALIQSADQRAFLALQKTERRQPQSIIGLARSFWAAGQLFLVSDYATLISDRLRKAQLTYHQCEFALFAYEMVGVSELARQLASKDCTEPHIQRAIESLHHCSGIANSEFMDRVVPVARFLAHDQVGPYHQLDSATKSVYRRAIAEAARRNGDSLEDVASAASRFPPAIDVTRNEPAARLRFFTSLGMQHECDRWSWRSKVRLAGYHLAGLALSVTIIAAIAPEGPHTEPFALIALASVILLMLSYVLPLVEAVLGACLQPRHCFRLDFRASGVPGNSRVVIATPVMLSSEAQVDSILDNARWNISTAADSNVCLALLTDFPDGPERGRTIEQDRLLAYLDDQVRKMRSEELSVHVLHRERNQLYDGNWIGWERKRGKLIQLNKLIVTGTSSFDRIFGELQSIVGAEYVLCLDEDSRISRDCVQLLAGFLSHPFNRPVLSQGGDRVVTGYGIAVPKFVNRAECLMGWRIPSAYFGPTGSERHPVSRTRNFLFDYIRMAQYPGKGMYSVAAFHAILPEHRFREGELLSHDTVEGALLRTAYNGDCVISEQFPPSRLALLMQLHRWIRGEVQNFLLLWMRDRKTHFTRLPGFFGYLLYTQIRLNLIPALIVMVTSCWIISPSATTYAALGAMIGGMLAAPLFQVANRALASRHEAVPWRAKVRTILNPVLSIAVAAVFRFIGAWTVTWISLDAMLRSVIRCHSGRRLLEWRSAATVQSDVLGALDVPGVWMGALAGAIVLCTVLLLRGPSAESVIIACWTIYPFVIDRLVRRGAPSTHGHPDPAGHA